MYVFTAWRRHVIWNNKEHLSQFTLHAIKCTVNGMFYHREKDSQTTFTKKKGLLYFLTMPLGITTSVNLLINDITNSVPTSILLPYVTYVTEHTWNQVFVARYLKKFLMRALAILGNSEYL
jgi:hypothetical protein